MDSKERRGKGQAIAKATAVLTNEGKAQLTLPCNPPPLKRLSDFRLESARLNFYVTTGSASKALPLQLKTRKQVRTVANLQSVVRAFCRSAAKWQRPLLAPSELRNDPALVAAAVAQNGYARSMRLLHCK